MTVDEGGKGKAGFKSFLPTSHSAVPARNEETKKKKRITLATPICGNTWLRRWDVNGVRREGRIDEVKANE